MLAKYLLGRSIGKQRRRARKIRGPQPRFQPPREVDGDPPIRPCFAGPRHRPAHPRDPPLGVRHRALLLAPGRRGQQHVGEGGGLGVGIRFLQYDELRPGEPRAHGRLVRQRLRGIRARDPDHPDVAGGKRREHFHRRLARLRGYVVDSPERGHFRPVLLVREIAMPRHQRRHAADFATAHRVRLTRQRERPGAGPADLARREMEIDERRVFRRSRRRLVEPLAVERQHCLRFAEPARRLHQIFRSNAADAGDRGRRVLAHQRLQFRETRRVSRNVGGVDPFFP